MDDNKQFITTEKFEKLEQKVGDMLVRLSVAESNIREMREDLSAIKDNTVWIIRLILGGIIAAIMGVIIKGGI